MPARGYDWEDFMGQFADMCLENEMYGTSMLDEDHEPDPIHGFSIGDRVEWRSISALKRFRGYPVATVSGFTATKVRITTSFPSPQSTGKQKHSFLANSWELRTRC